MDEITKFDEIFISSCGPFRDWYCYEVDADRVISTYSANAVDSTNVANAILVWKAVDVYDDTKQFCKRFRFDRQLTFQRPN